jgi:hypothetical protein
VSRQRLLPPEISKLLSTVPLVTVSVGVRDPVTARVALAPYEDCIYLLVRRASPLLDALRKDPRMSLTHRGEGAVSVNLTGRALAGRPLAIDPLRLELLPWLPEGANQSQFAVIPFWVEVIDYHRTEADRFHGKTTAAAKPSSGSRWTWTLLGARWPFALLGTVGSFTWIALVPEELALKPVACAVMVIAVLSGVCAPGGWYRAASFEGWRRGRLPLKQSGMVGEALLSPASVVQVSIALLVLHVLSVALLSWWGQGLGALGLAAGFGWLLWPWAATQVFTGEDSASKV